MVHVAQTSFEYRTHGGARVGAGRPLDKTRARPSEKHIKRETVRPNEPVHVNTRAVPSVGRLRTKEVYAAIRDATAGMLISEAEQTDPTKRFRIIHLSIQSNHLHLIVEAYDQYALARGMQSFLRSCAKRINTVLGRRGEPVFYDRYHATVLRSPRQVRNTLAYVLNNWRKHGEDRGKAWKIDPYATGLHFPWKERVHDPFAMRAPEAYRPLYVWLPTTWLLRVGWQRRGERVGMYEVPSSARAIGQ